MSILLTSRLSTVVEILLRVPPIFVLDELCKISFNMPAVWRHSISNNDLYKNDAIMIVLLKLVLYVFGCCSMVLIAILRLKSLCKVYVYMVEGFCIYLSYWLHVILIKHAMARSITLDDLFLYRYVTVDYKIIADIFSYNVYENLFIPHMVLQSILSVLYYCMYRGPKFEKLGQMVAMSFVSPIFLCMLPLPHAVLQHIPSIAVSFPLALFVYVIWSNIHIIVESLIRGWRYCRNFIVTFGLPALVETEWNRLKIQHVLRVFFVFRLVEYCVMYMYTLQQSDLTVIDRYGNVNPIPNVSVSLQHLFDKEIFMQSVNNVSSAPHEASDTITDSVPDVVKFLLITGCETSIAVLGMTSVISCICYHLGFCFRKVLLTDDDDKNFGTVSGVLFYILSLQTGLTSLEPEKRYVRLCRNFCLLFTAILHLVHGILNPLMLSLSASHNMSLQRHARALIVSVFLIIYPTFLTLYLWKTNEISTWLLAVSVFSVEVIIKTIITLIIYWLFLLDSLRQYFWEELDDYVYYIRACGNTIEFCFGIFLFCNGFWILMFESGGAIRAVMMCVHAYFNIWCEAKAGWINFMKRRTAVQKISTLPDASAEQLVSYGDVCSICYQQMKTAKITVCRHYFHTICLRKWLYLQDNCPMCHHIIYLQPSINTNGSASPVHSNDRNR